MVSPFAGYEDENRRRKRAMLGLPPETGMPVDPNPALLAEFERRGINPGPAFAMSATPQELTVNLKARLAAETRPEVQQVRENVRAPNGRSFGDFLRETFRTPEPPPDAGLLDRLLPGFRSLSIPTLPEAAIAPVPERLQPAARALRELTSPLSLATLPIGGVKGGLLGAGGFVGGSQAGSEIGGPKGELIGGVIGGVGVPLAPAAGRAAARGGAKLAEEVGKTNVGNVLLPRAPARAAKPLIYENLHPTERQLYGIQSKGRLTLDETQGARDYLYGPVDPATGRRPGGLISPEDTSQIQNFEERYRGTHQLAARQREVARVLAKYAPPETPATTGPIAQVQAARPLTKPEFVARYNELSMALDSSEHPQARPLTANEADLMNADPIAFSRSRGYSKAEIAQFQEWLDLHGGLVDEQIGYDRSPEHLYDLLQRNGRVPFANVRTGPTTGPATGPIAQAGFGGEMGPGQVARGAAEQTRMTQAPLSEVAASEADRIAKARLAASWSQVTGHKLAPGAATDMRSLLRPSGGPTAGVPPPDDFFARVRDALTDVEAAPGRPVGARQVYESFLRKSGLSVEQMPPAQFAQRLAQGADEASGIRGIPSSRPGEATSKQVQIPWQRESGGREWLAFVARRTEPAAGPRPPAAPPSFPAGAGLAAARPAPATHAAIESTVPPVGGGDILGDIERELRNFSSNKAAARQFVNESLRPVFEKTFGDSPVMDVLAPYANMPIVDASGRAMSREPLIAISTAGWRARAEQLGLKYAGTHGSDDVYRIPGLELPAPPAAAPPAAVPPPSVAATPPFAPTGAVSQAAVTSPPAVTPPRSVIASPPPTQPPVPPPPPAPPAAVLPPAGPPVPPAGIPPSQPPLMPTRPSGIEQTLKQAKAIVERDRPGITSRLMDYLPGLKQTRHAVQPALDQPETMTAGWVGQGLAEGKVETSLQKARIDQLARLDAEFGKGATATRDFKPASVAFKGTPEEAKYPYVGTLADIMERPALYDMSAERRAAIAATHNERSLAFGGTKNDYGLDIGEHPVQPGGVHIASVGVGEDDIEIAGSLENALRSGRDKTRIYETLADRWAHDNKFRPETSVSKLFAHDDHTLATLSGRKVLVEGMGGKTRLQVMQETHPELAAKMAGLQTRLASLRATAARIGGEQADAIDNFMQSPLDPADLASLQADLNPRVGANAVGRQGPNFGKDFKALKSEVAAVKAQIAALRPAWKNANLKPYVFVEDHVYRYFPVKEAKQAKNLLKTSESRLLRIIDNLRATAFGGDFSPFTIQGLTAWFSDPIGVSRFVAQGKAGVSQASVLADMKANPASWQRFTAATGINPLGGVEKEFSAGYLGHPKLGKFGKGWKEWNEALYRPITKYQKDVFDNSYAAAVKHGLGPEQAAAVAADDATKIIPRSNFRRLGQSTRDAARYRAAVTSVSFLTQPVALMNDATKGLVKIGTKQTLTRSEVFAVKRVLTIVAATEAIAITSNVYHAQRHDLDIEQAVRDSLNPNSGKFMSLVFPNGARVGLGGPFRSIIRMIAPREIEGVPVPVPFGGVEKFAKGKMGPVVRIGYDEIRNKDYYGKAIRTENFPVNILQGIEYALEGSAPLTVGSAAQQLRKGESIGTVVQEAGSQFAGTNYQPDDPAYAATLLWKKDVKGYFDIPANAKEAKDKGKYTRTKYRQKNPQVEAKLFIAGDVKSLSTGTAKRELVQLMKDNNIKVTDIKHLAPKDYESDEHAALRDYLERSLGVPNDKRAKRGKR